mmetsp:Transcript_13082/g.25376  ORF Transcript_13082/g.25376 Transcript_13082/m.25376 type:complete len:265 (+) Transcript_13082:335-1129(+)
MALHTLQNLGITVALHLHRPVLLRTCLSIHHTLAPLKALINNLSTSNILVRILLLNSNILNSTSHARNINNIHSNLPIHSSNVRNINHILLHSNILNSSSSNNNNNVHNINNSNALNSNNMVHVAPCLLPMRLNIRNSSNSSKPKCVHPRWDPGLDQCNITNLQCMEPGPHILIVRCLARLPVLTANQITKMHTLKALSTTKKLPIQAITRHRPRALYASRKCPLTPSSNLSTHLALRIILHLVVLFLSSIRCTKMILRTTFLR